jgi:hypothetical protein
MTNFLHGLTETPHHTTETPHNTASASYVITNPPNDTPNSAQGTSNTSHAIDDFARFTGSVAEITDNAIHITDDVASVYNANDDEHVAEDTKKPSFTRRMMTFGQLASGVPRTIRRRAGGDCVGRRCASVC